MHHTIIFVFISFLLGCFFLFVHRFGSRKSGANVRLPPGPYPFPIIGNILSLGNKPHNSLAILSRTYGPLMSLKLGATTTIVVSSREIVRELFSKHDLSFSSRSIPFSAHGIRHPEFSMVWLPVGDQWRRIRRVCKEYLFSIQQLDASRLLRAEKVRELLDHVSRCCVRGQAVDVGQVASTTTLNVLSNFVFSVDLAHYESDSSQDFKNVVGVLMELAGKPNVADFFPVLQPLDPQRLLRKANVYCEKLMAFFDGIIEKRVREQTTWPADAPSLSNDVTDLLLDLRRKEKSSISLDEIRHLYFDLFLAGTDTTSSTLEWAMTELIRNPEIMAKVRIELEKVTGKEDGVLIEQDISKLPYLRAVIKETLRLHPPGPFLVPRKAIRDVEIGGFVVPKDAQVLCNLWAMGRDPGVWSNAQTFMPERFLDLEIDYKGQDFELIPFGAGRRMCPGLPLAHRMLHLMLGSLIHEFDWKAEDIDMDEKFGITLQKKQPLLAVPFKL